ncbi:MAG: hypothetical protein HY925_13720 [Elusimicrobia bacterium]|nr:hypothetical protein [Elusimicrobiota bacterium]
MMLGAILTSGLAASLASAQSCPAGTSLVFIDDAGSEKIIHCAKPQKGPKAALRALRRSEMGRRIADFISEHDIPILPAGDVPSGSGAVFLWNSKEIHLPQNADELDATMLAVALAHEGTHAIQAIQDEMVQCIESEQDAYFVHFVAYVEMRRAGVPPIPESGPFARDLLLMAHTVKQGSFRSFDDLVKLGYEAQRKRVLGVGGRLRPVWRGVLRASVRVFDFLYDYSGNTETLDRKRRHVAYWWDKTSVKRTQAAHTRTLGWRDTWINAHRHEDFSGR